MIHFLAGLRISSKRIDALVVCAVVLVTAVLAVSMPNLSVPLLIAPLAITAVLIGILERRDGVFGDNLPESDDPTQVILARRWAKPVLAISVTVWSGGLCLLALLLLTLTRGTSFQRAAEVICLLTGFHYLRSITAVLFTRY